MLFGVIALLIVGASWCLVGVILGRAPKDGFDTASIQLGSAFVTILVSAVISCFAVRSECAASVLWCTCGVYFMAGVFNYYGLQAMARGMSLGPNGIVWGIMQSALIFSFLGGIIFFDEKLTLWRGIGILLLAAALVCFGVAGDNTRRTGAKSSWRIWAFLALGLMAVQQNVSNAPSFFPACREVSSVLRTLAAGAGTASAASIGLMIQSTREHGYANKLWSDCKRPLMWLYVAIPLFFSLLFAYTLFYPGMDAMAEAGAGAVNYPLMVGSCIVSFTLYSRIFLKEKLKPLQIAALALCLVGLAGLCVPA